METKKRVRNGRKGRGMVEAKPQARNRSRKPTDARDTR
jgi:hypothetical protein